jgi:uncharacterized protein (TIGR03435 family)
MRKLKFMLSMIALAALPEGALFAQNLVGTWQGALQPPQAAGRQLRIVIKISRADDESLKAVLYSIDQGGQPIPASTVSQNGSTIKMTISALNGNYEGKVSGDGNSIAGTWTQGQPLPLNLTRATPETAWTIPEPPPPPVRMAADAKPEFEVATIKPSDPARPGKLFTVRGQEVITINTTLSDLTTMAYDLHPKQIVGAPAWVESDKFDVTGKPDVPGQPNVTKMKIMFQKLLADRFQLKFHREKRELSVYALTVGKPGPKFKKSERDPNGLPGLFFQGNGGLGTALNVTNATMQEFANLLQAAVLDKPVVDQTGLAEKYDFILKFTPEEGQMLGLRGPNPPPPPENAEAPPDLFAAVQQQLGLKLESTKAPADVLVIDHVEKPSAN